MITMDLRTELRLLDELASRHGYGLKHPNGRTFWLPDALRRVKACVVCHEEFLRKPKGHGQLCCSLECRKHRHDARSLETPVFRECRDCGKPFYPERNARMSRYCSKGCRQASRTRIRSARKALHSP
jgi:hypothetical protein